MRDPGVAAASQTLRRAGDNRERLRYLTLLDELSGKILVSPGVNKEIGIFLGTVGGLRMSGRYRRALDYICRKLHGREAKATESGAAYMAEADEMPRPFKENISDNDFELLIYGLALADSRGPAAVLTNDALLVKAFRNMANFLDGCKFAQRNPLSVYAKYDAPEFRNLAVYPEANGAKPSEASRG